MRKKTKVIPARLAWIAAALGCASLPQAAQAGRFEVSSGFSYSRTDYGERSYSWTRRWGANFGYHFSERSEIEVSFQDVVDRTLINGYQDTTTHDRIYAFNWVQSLLGKGYLIDPYFKLGIGQLNRDANGTYASGGSPSSQVDAVTGILGAGLRIGVTKAFGVRMEANTYLAGGSLRGWRDNVSLNAGFSFYF